MPAATVTPHRSLPLRRSARAWRCPRSCSTSRGRGRRCSVPPQHHPRRWPFLAEDMAVVNGSRVPFVRDAEGRVQWVSAGLRLVPRVDAVA